MLVELSRNQRYAAYLETVARSMAVTQWDTKECANPGTCRVRTCGLLHKQSRLCPNGTNCTAAFCTSHHPDGRNACTPLIHRTDGKKCAMCIPNYFV